MTVDGATHFYRYTAAEPVDWLRPVILKNLIYVPTASQLNDPAEARPLLAPKSARETARVLSRLSLAEKPHLSLEERAAHLGYVKTGIAVFGVDRIWREATLSLQKHLQAARIFSMSKRVDNMSMWAKYAANHTGCCLEFANEGMFSKAVAVEYGKIEPIELGADGSMGIDFHFRKKADWSNEEEIRLLLPRFFPELIPFDPALLTRVVLGKDIRRRKRNQIIEWARARERPLTVAQATYDVTHHELIVTDIPSGEPLQPIATESKTGGPKAPQVPTARTKNARQSPSGKRRE